LPPRLLVYGYEPFGTEPVNPSGAAVRALSGTSFGDVDVHTVVLPVTWDGTFALLQRVLEELRPTLVLGVGQGTDCFQVETRALNANGPKPDNAGALAGPLVEQGAAGELPVTLDAQAMLDAVTAVVSGVPVRRSDNAGGFLCNHTLYKTLSWGQHRGAACGFLHVPRLGHAPQHTINAAVAAAVAALAQNPRLAATT